MCGWEHALATPNYDCVTQMYFTESMLLVVGYTGGELFDFASYLVQNAGCAFALHRYDL